jgi:hypothetical protein
MQVFLFEKNETISHKLKKDFSVWLLFSIAQNIKKYEKYFSKIILCWNKWSLRDHVFRYQPIKSSKLKNHVIYFWYLGLFFCCSLVLFVITFVEWKIILFVQYFVHRLYTYIRLSIFFFFFFFFFFKIRLSFL